MPDLPLRRRLSVRALSLAALGAALLVPASASANHPVMGEGNCMGAQTAAAPGTCGDRDGDGRLGRAEDLDNDRVFGTISGALGEVDLGSPEANMLPTNQNGRVQIISDGQFPESIMVGRTARNPNPGNVTIEASPGVEAAIDAVVQGVDGGAARQEQTGVLVNAPANRRVTLRNLTIRNWAEGVRVTGSSRVTMDEVRLESNLDYGLRVLSTSRAAVRDSLVTATGFRVAPMTRTEARPGDGIRVQGRSALSLFDTTISGSKAAGVRNSTSNAARATRARRIRLADSVQLSANSPNISGPVVFERRDLGN